MLKRPTFVIVCSALFLYFPFELGWRLARGFQWTWVDLIVNVALPAILLFGLVRVTKTGWYTLVAILSFWGVRDLALYYRENHARPTALLVHILIYGVSLAYFINPRVRRLYFDPRLRWWRTKPRYETHLPMLIETLTHPAGAAKGEKQFQYRVLRNVSEGGCFVETDAPLPMNAQFDLALPLPIPLNVSVLSSRGEVRWVSTQAGKTGMGVQFVNADAQQRRAFKQFVKEQL